MLESEHRLVTALSVESQLGVLKLVQGLLGSRNGIHDERSLYSADESEILGGIDHVAPDSDLQGLFFIAFWWQAWITQPDSLT